jgi:hypothetical protein
MENWNLPVADWTFIAVTLPWLMFYICQRVFYPGLSGKESGKA